MEVKEKGKQGTRYKEEIEIEEKRERGRPKKVEGEKREAKRMKKYLKARKEEHVEISYINGRIIRLLRETENEKTMEENRVNTKKLDTNIMILYNKVLDMKKSIETKEIRREREKEVWRNEIDNIKEESREMKREVEGLKRKVKNSSEVVKTNTEAQHLKGEEGKAVNRGEEAVDEQEVINNAGEEEESVTVVYHNRNYFKKLSEVLSEKVK